MNDILAVILGGGRGTRLFPLTHERSKPAVPIAGKYRLIDIPISNCLNSDLRRIFVLTQYNSESLNKHISLAYKFDVFSDAFVSILAAEQTEESADWFQGTADAVRQVRRHLAAHKSTDVLILSGDQLFQMDFRQLQETHRTSGADATLAVIPVDRDKTAGFGILKVDPSGRIVHFEEKPGAHRLDELESEIPGKGRGFLASMGIYLFRRAALESALEDRQLVDFGPLRRVDAHEQRRDCAAGDCRDPRNYLDTTRFEDNAAFRDRNDALGRPGNTDGFVAGPASVEGTVAVNDRLAVLSYDEVMARVKHRVALELALCLRGMPELPVPEAPCTPGGFVGRVPDAALLSPGCNASPDEAGWWARWKPHVLYARASPSGLSVSDSQGNVSATGQRFAVLVTQAAHACEAAIECGVDGCTHAIAPPRGAGRH
ncbi:MAG TPA: sugar phosphate nucleotidyltransferase, partial [Anaeromyxobacteraceae bacterium]|nr:sugar phosphate nucleotidyltransferase [Anaeromyxobacteraceae bacterium]